MRTLYLSLEEVLFLHGELIRRFAATAGCATGASWRARSPGRAPATTRRSRCRRPRSCRASARDAFVDGNKRVAFAATAIFLRMNGHALRVTADEGEEFLIQRAIVGRAELDEIAGWLERHMRAV